MTTVSIIAAIVLVAVIVVYLITRPYNALTSQYPTPVAAATHPQG